MRPSDRLFYTYRNPRCGSCQIGGTQVVTATESNNFKFREDSNTVQSSSENATTTERYAGEYATKQYKRFSALLQEWGFTSTQLVLISDAIREAGLKLAEDQSWEI